MGTPGSLPAMMEKAQQFYERFPGKILKLIWNSATN